MRVSAISTLCYFYPYDKLQNSGISRFFGSARRFFGAYLTGACSRTPRAFAKNTTVLQSKSPEIILLYDFHSILSHNLTPIQYNVRLLTRFYSTFFSSPRQFAWTWKRVFLLVKQTRTTIKTSRREAPLISNKQTQEQQQRIKLKIMFQFSLRGRSPCYSRIQFTLVHIIFEREVERFYVFIMIVVTYKWLFQSDVQLRVDQPDCGNKFHQRWNFILNESLKLQKAFEIFGNTREKKPSYNV